MKFLFILLLFSAAKLPAKLNPSSGVTYTLSGGRFGDNILSVAHALWLAHSLDLPLVYTPFPYSDKLKLSTLAKTQNFSKACVLNSAESYTKLWKSCFSKNLEDPLLITLAYSPEFTYEYDPAFPVYTQINWDEPTFIEKLRTHLSPLHSIPEPVLPMDRTSVALHIRTGAGFDIPKFQALWPLKGPPFSYYVDSLKTIWEMLKSPLYVYIFTDHQNPTELQKKLATAFAGCDIVFACRKEENRQDLNVLEDFFAMGKFSCLIRTDSHYSLMAEKLFPYQIVISPLHANKLSKKEFVIDKLLIQVKSANKVSQPIRTVVSTTQ
jgi:hypothetical protein